MLILHSQVSLLGLAKEMSEELRLSVVRLSRGSVIENIGSVSYYPIFQLFTTCVAWLVWVPQRGGDP